MLWLLLACNDNLLVQKGVGQEGETLQNVGMA